MIQIQQRELNNIIGPYLEIAKVKEMNDYIQHGTVTTLEHCIAVATLSYKIAKKLGIKDIDTVVVGALLHDFYLYDWHDIPNRFSLNNALHRSHGMAHPIIARQNAEVYIGINEKVGKVIESHMFPLTLLHVPTSKASMIVCMVDKILAVQETVKGFVTKRQKVIRA